MALIKCSECGKEYSDKASSCPQCACPTSISKNSTNEENNVKVDIGSKKEIVKSVNNKKIMTTVKDIAILLLIWGPLLFFVIGGLGVFDGTFIEPLFSALFFGFIAGFLTILFVGSLFKNYPIVWLISALLVFIVIVVFYLLNFIIGVAILFFVIISLVLLLVFIKWIMGEL